VRPAEANCADVHQAMSSICACRQKRRDASRTDEARVLVRRSEMAEVGPKHHASGSRGKPQGEPGEAALAKEHSA